MAASVTVHHKAFGDPRIAYLGQLAGYSTREALGAMTLLWSVCTERQSETPTIAEIRSCIGPRGEEHLVEAGLGEIVQPGVVRVKGCDGMIEWYGTVLDRNTKGGKARVQNAPRDARGRLLPRSQKGSSDPAASLPPPASESDPDPDQEPERESLSLPEQQSARDLPDDRASTQENLIPFPRSSPVESASSLQSTSSPQSPEDQERALEPALRKTDDELRERRKLVDHVRDRLRDMRAAIAKELGEDVRPLPLQGRGEVALAARIRESGTIERARADCEHVLAIMAAEARAERSVKWLTDSAFEEKSWRCKLGMTLRDIRGTQAARAAAGDGPRIVMPAWGDHTAPDWSPES